MSASSSAAIKRVLMTADAVGGVWTYAMELCREFRTRGVHVMLATMGTRLLPDQHAEVERFDNVILRESDFDLEWMDDPWHDVARAGDWLLDLEDEFDPDVVHLNGYVHANLLWRAPTLVAGHSCVLSWWRAVKNEPAPAEWAKYAEKVGAGLRAANRVIAPSHAMAMSLREHYGVELPVEVIPNGRGAPALETTKEEFVLSVGRVWDEAKGIAALAAVARELSWPVRIVGEQRGGQVEGEFQNVEFLGRLSRAETNLLFAHAAIYVLPAYYEPFGLSVLEAAQRGCALVLGDIPSLRENWGDAAVFVKPGDRDQLRATISGLIQSPERRRFLGSAAQETAARFSSERMAESYLAAYRELCSRTAAQTAARFGTL